MSARPLLLALLVVALPAAALPPIQSWDSATGARVLFVHAPEIPMVDIEVVFDAGAARDDGRDGLARMVNGLLEEGADGLDADAIATGFESLGAETGFSSQRDMASMSLRSLSDPAKLDPAVELMARVLARPDFPPTAVERVRGQMLAGLLQVKQSPGELASRAFYETVYAGHPYANHPEGTEETVRAIDRDALVAFHDRYYGAANAVVAIVGDLSREQAAQIAERVVVHLPAGERAPRPPEVAPAEPASLVVDYPSKQVHLVMGQPGLRRGDPDYFPLYLGNHVLGGSGLVSQLAKAVREERGLSYSVGSGFVPMRAEGPFRISLQTKAANAGEAVTVVRDTLETFIHDGPGAEELERSKSNIINGFPLRIDSNSKILSYLLVIGFYDLPLDYLATFTDRIEAVTAEQIRDAFQRRVDPERLVTVLAGPVDDTRQQAIGDGAAGGE